MLTTANFALKKPELADSPPDITVTNSNWDTVDKHLKNAVVIPKAGGTTGTAITLNDVTLTDGFMMKFRAVYANGGAATTVNTKPLYKPGTTTAPTLIAGKAYEIWYDTAGSCFFLKASAEGNVVVADVLAGKTFSNDSDTGLTGTMANRGSVGTQVLATEQAEYTIPAGYHNGLGKVKAVITNLIASVIKAGTTVGGVLGTFTSDATAADVNVLASKTYYRNGVKGTGSMPDRSLEDIVPNAIDGTYTAGRLYVHPQAGYYNTTKSIMVDDADFVSGNLLASKNIFGLQGNIPERGTVVITPSTVNQAITQGYHNGTGYVWGDPGLIPDNILLGKTIFGQVGTAIKGLRFIKGVATSGADSVDFKYYNMMGLSGAGLEYPITAAGLPSKPDFILIRASPNSPLGSLQWRNNAAYPGASELAIGTYWAHCIPYTNGVAWVNSSGFYLPSGAAANTAVTWVAVYFDSQI